MTDYAVPTSRVPFDDDMLRLHMWILRSHDNRAKLGIANSILTKYLNRLHPSQDLGHIGREITNAIRERKDGEVPDGLYIYI